MPKAYILFQEKITDQNVLDTEYLPKAMGSMGGHTIGMAALTQDFEVLEGEWFGNQTVVLEFESVDAAKAWYNSPAYQEAVPLRQKGADCNVVLLPGFGA